MCSSFGTNAAVLTADNFFIFAKRSAQVGSRPNVWSSSANEALSRDLDNRGRSVPNLYDVMRRGIKEELAIDEEEYKLEMLIVQIEMETHQWGASWLAKLHDLTGEDVIARRRRGVADKWEHSELNSSTRSRSPFLNSYRKRYLQAKWLRNFRFTSSRSSAFMVGFTLNAPQRRSSDKPGCRVLVSIRRVPGVTRQ